MALSAGDRLGLYEILSPLGAGGMGEVYRATDTRLGREVAIKILPGEVAKDPERLQRFQREAHLLAALNHPHIAAIHGLEEADGQPFLVLELVEGEDLRERLARGAIPVDEALEIAAQVAQALEEAHNTGIVHRDLKPANVKVTPAGKVKVLDFGLAKAWASDAAEGMSSSASMSQSPTLAHSVTQAGVILGTAAYMSPEQARGKPVDKRTDVWAFGVLFWEMLTGRTLFTGDTVTDVIAAVVKEEPDLDALPARTPRVVRWLLARCLRKDPRARLPDVGAARLALQEVVAGTAPEAEALVSDTGETAPAERKRRLKERCAWATIAVVAAGVGATLASIYGTEVLDPRPATRFVVDPPEGWEFTDKPVPSPDGRHIVFRATPDVVDGGAASPMLWLHALKSGTARPLTGTEGSNQFTLFWSPDSRHVAFAVEAELRKISLAEGTVQTICSLPGRSFPADWNEEDIIILGALDESVNGNLYTVKASGGEPTLLMKPDSAQGEVLLVPLRFLPDGRRFVFLAVAEGSGLLGVYVGSLDDPDHRRQLMPGRHAQFAGQHVLFNRESTLVAQPFDAEHAEVTGEPVAIASVARFNRRGLFGVSPGGTLAYLSGESARSVQLAWLDRKGERTETLGAPAPYRQIALSPDEKRVAVEVRDTASRTIDLWVVDVSRGVPTRVTRDPANDMHPVWSPDSQELVFQSVRGDHSLFRKALRGGPAVPILERNAEVGGAVDIPESWSPDGKNLLFETLGGNTVWALPLEEEGEPEAVLESGFRLNEPQFSPDGRLLAYISDESGGWEVYVQPFRKPGDKVRVSAAGGGQPKWRGDGKELFYLAPDGQMMAVDVREGAAGPEVSLPTALFKMEEWTDLDMDEYGVTADGQRFLVKLPVEGGDKLRMHVVLNWESLLETGE